MSDLELLLMLGGSVAPQSDTVTVLNVLSTEGQIGWTATLGRLSRSALTMRSAVYEVLADTRRLIGPEGGR